MRDYLLQFHEYKTTWFQLKGSKSDVVVSHWLKEQEQKKQGPQQKHIIGIRTNKVSYDR